MERGLVAKIIEVMIRKPQVEERDIATICTLTSQRSPGQDEK
jgi:hypothetical protein